MVNITSSKIYVEYTYYVNLLIEYLSNASLLRQSRTYNNNFLFNKCILFTICTNEHNK
jgi:hypothetical protein